MYHIDIHTNSPLYSLREREKKKAQSKLTRKKQNFNPTNSQMKQIYRQKIK